MIVSIFYITISIRPVTISIRLVTLSIHPVAVSIRPVTVSIRPVTVSIRHVTVSIRPVTVSICHVTVSIRPVTVSIHHVTVSIRPVTVSIPPVTVSICPVTVSIHPLKVIPNIIFFTRMFECDINNFTINKEPPVWHNYFLCGLKGLLEHCKVADPKGLQCVVDGTIPKSAGLSSSSALVCCAALATMHANNQSLTKVFLKTILILFFLFLVCLTVG